MEHEWSYYTCAVAQYGVVSYSMHNISRKAVPRTSHAHCLSPSPPLSSPLLSLSRLVSTHPSLSPYGKNAKPTLRFCTHHPSKLPFQLLRTVQYCTVPLFAYSEADEDEEQRGSPSTSKV